MKESGFARYLHSAVLINGAMLIFGGNTHNDTSLSNGAKCFSADFLAYDIGMYLLGLYKVGNIRNFSCRDSQIHYLTACVCHFRGKFSDRLLMEFFLILAYRLREQTSWGVVVETGNLEI